MGGWSDVFSSVEIRTFVIRARPGGRDKNNR
jgi:hypothetical protein